MACSDCVFEVEARSVKVFINGCKNVRLSLRGKIITHTLELYKCEDCAIDIGTKVWTAQLDLCKRCRLEFASREDFQTIISAGCHEVKIRLADMAESVGSASVDFGALKTEAEAAGRTVSEERTQWKTHFRECPAFSFSLALSYPAAAARLWLSDDGAGRPARERIPNHR